MTATQDVLSAARSLPRRRRAFLEGTLLGAAATLIGSGLFIIVFVTDVALVSLRQRFANVSRDWLILLVAAVVIGYVLTAFLAAAPGCLGGGVIALALQHMARSGRFTTLGAMAVGAAVGLCTGLATYLYLYLLGPIRVLAYDRGALPQFLLVITSIATPLGLLHGCLYGRWLRRRMA